MTPRKLFIQGEKNRSRRGEKKEKILPLAGRAKIQSKEELLG